MVKYEMHNRESSVYPNRPGTIAAVGHASTHRVHVPHRSGGGTSGSIASDTNNSPRKNQEPDCWLIKHVFFPIHPSPASRAYDRSSSGAVSTQIFDSTGSPALARTIR